MARNLSSDKYDPTGTPEGSLAKENDLYFQPSIQAADFRRLLSEVVSCTLKLLSGQVEPWPKLCKKPT